MAWEIPPDTSHLYGWYIVDGYGSLVRAHGSPGTGVHGAILTVSFTVSKDNKSLGDTYDYPFHDETVARSWLSLLRQAAEPGKVIWAMRRAGIQGYKR